MLRFKQFLKEYLTGEQRSRYANIKMSDEARQATDHFFGAGNDHVREELKGFEPDKSEIHQKIEQHLGKAITVKDYKDGVTQDKYGRTVKIGKAISDPKLRDEFNRDNTRAGVKKAVSHYVTVVRGTEVAGQTNSATDPAHPKGHSWGGQSCKNVDTGSNRHYLEREIRHGTVVMRVHDHNDQEIYRATLHPHHNEHGDTAYRVESEYGVKHPAFTEHAHDVATRLSGEFKPGTFKKHPEVYDDSGKSTMIHPAASAEDLHHLISTTKHPDFDMPDILSHRNANSSHVERVLQTPHFQKDPYPLQAAVESKGATKEQLDSIFKRDDRYLFNKDEHINSLLQLHALNKVKDSRITPEHIESVMKAHAGGGMWMDAAVAHPSASHDQISRGLNHHAENTRFAAATNPSLSSKHVDDVLNDPDATPSFKKEILSHPTAVTPNHISRILQEPYPENDRKRIRLANLKSHVATLPKLTAGHIKDILDNEPEHHVRAAAVQHDNMPSALMDKALDDPSYDVRRAAIRHPTAVESRHIDKALGDEDYRVREMAITHPDAVEPHHIDRALNDSFWRVRHLALSHPKATADHLIKGLLDENQAVRQPAFNLAHDMMQKTTDEQVKKKLHAAMYGE